MKICTLFLLGLFRLQQLLNTEVPSVSKLCTYKHIFNPPIINWTHIELVSLLKPLKASSLFRLVLKPLDVTPRLDFRISLRSTTEDGTSQRGWNSCN